MTVSALTREVEYIANGSQTDFPFSFKVMELDDLNVYLDDVLQSSGYTVTGIGTETGNVEFSVAPSNGVVVLIRRVTDQVQNLDLVAYDRFPAESVEKELDRQVMMIQELDDDKTDTGHSHVESDITDLDKYTQAEVDSKDAALQAQITTNAAGISTNASDLAAHEADNSNPHSVTAAQAGASPVGHTHTLADVTDSGEMAAIDDAPSDNQIHGRKNGAWVVGVSGGTWGGIGGNIEDQADLQTELEKKQAVENGHTDRTESTMSFDDGTLTFTIEPVAADFNFFAGGTKYTKTTAQTVTITDTEGLWFFYFDTSGVLQSTQTFVDEIITTYALCALIYWDSSAAAHLTLAEERHGNTMDSMTHLYNHNTIGTRYGSGMQVGDVLTEENGSLDTHVQFSVSSGDMWDEDIKVDNAAVAVGGLIPILWRTGTGDWNIDTTAVAAVKTTGTGRAAYNEESGGTWSLTEVTSGDFLCMHLYATNDMAYPYFLLMGQQEYNTINAARQGAANELLSLETDGMPVVEYKSVATFIVQTSNTYSNAYKSRMRSDDDGNDYIDWRFVDVGAVLNVSGATSTVWGDIAGTLSDQTDLQAALDAKSDTTHNHDADYAAIGHNHDADYADIAHTHELDELDATGITDGHVLTANGSNGAVWEAPTGGGTGNLELVGKTASFAPHSSDFSGTGLPSYYPSTASGMTVTLDTGATSGFSINDRVRFYNGMIGAITFAAGTGATVVSEGGHNLTALQTYGYCEAWLANATTWVIGGPSVDKKPPKVTVLTSGTAATHTFDVACKYYDLIVTAGGGGGYDGTAASYSSCGGAAGGTAIKKGIAKTAATATYTVGAGGTSGSSPTAGGSSSFADGTVTVSATGGEKAAASGDHATSGGVGSGGDINLYGGGAGLGAGGAGTSFAGYSMGGGSYWGTGGSENANGAYGAGGMGSDNQGIYESDGVGGVIMVVEHYE